MPKIGDKVLYDGIECALIQGVAAPYWDLLPMDDSNMEQRKRVVLRRIHETDFKLQPFRKRAWWSFYQTYQFLMQCWFLIDVWNKSLFQKTYV